MCENTCASKDPTHFKVCFIPTPDLTYDSGSTVYAKDVMSALSRLGCDVHAIVSKRISIPNVKIHFDEEIDVYNPVILSQTVTSERIQKTIAKLTSMLIHVIQEEHIDVVHAFYSTFTSVSALFGKWLCGVPYIVSSFGRDVYAGCTQDERYRRMSRTSFLESAEIVASTKNIASRIHEMFNVSSSKLNVIPVGVDRSIFKPTSNERELHKIREELGVHGKMVLAIASDFTRDKGLDILIHSIPHVSSLFDVTFVVVGMDTTLGRSYQKKYLRLAKKLNVLDSIVLAGRRNHRDMPLYINASDIVVDPRLSCNFSSSALEATACGKPVVASSQGGAAEIVQSNENGLLFKTGDSKQMAECIVLLLKDGRLQQKLSINAIKNFDPSYSLEACVKKLLQVYRKALRKGPNISYQRPR